jgi:cyclic beta-1,2-glucan synthetase
MNLADKYHDPMMFERTAMLAWTHANIQRHHLGMEPSEAHLFQEIASRILYPTAALRPSQEILKKNTRGVDSLWSQGISGDLPIVLVRIDELEDREIVRQLLLSHDYWHLKNLTVDLVLLNERATSYIQELQAALEEMAHASPTSRHVFVLQSDRLAREDRIALLTAARIVFLSHHGTLLEQMERLHAQ